MNRYSLGGNEVEDFLKIGKSPRITNDYVIKDDD